MERLIPDPPAKLWEIILEAAWMLAVLLLLIAAAAAAWSAPAVTETQAGSPEASAAAVVRLPSHGASATVIWTGPGKSYLLGCAHAFEGRARTKPIRVDVPWPRQGSQARRVSIRLVGLGASSGPDLSLVELGDGPLPYVCRIAPGESRSAWSVGYDEMRWPAKVRPAHQLAGSWTYTRERPWHGRSGGALLDSRGQLVGVCHGYTGPPVPREVVPGERGIYVSHEAIVRFLGRHGYGWLVGAQPSAPAPAPAPKQASPVVIHIPPECWVWNVTGGQCAWCSIEVLARYHRIRSLYGLTVQQRGTTGPGGPERVLEARGVRYRSQSAGNRDTRILREAVAQGLGAMIGLSGSHCVVLVGFDGGSRLTVIDNSHRRPELVTRPLSAWDGWAIVLHPDSRAAPSRPQMPAAPACPPRG